MSRIGIFSYSIALWAKREQVCCSSAVLVCCMRGVVVKHNGCLFMHSVSDLGFIREHFKIALGIYVRISVAKLA